MEGNCEFTYQDENDVTRDLSRMFLGLNKLLKIIVHKLLKMPPHPSLSPLGRGLR